MTDIEAHITGTVWKIECAVGDTIEEGDTVAILESMKMEMPVEAEDAGTVSQISSRRARRSTRATPSSCSTRARRRPSGTAARNVACPPMSSPARRGARRRQAPDRPARRGVVRLTISNPAKRNALDQPILDAIARDARALARRTPARAA